jgi:hypothetical protein
MIKQLGPHPVADQFRRLVFEQTARSGSQHKTQIVLRNLAPDHFM